MFDIAIPKLSKEELASRYSRVKPMMRFKNKLHWMRDYTLEELSNMSYHFADEKDAGQTVREDLLVPMEGHDFMCLHTYGYHGFFKPSVAEVLSQLSEDEAHIACAFEIISSPVVAEDFNRSYFTRMALNKGFHVSTVRLYRRKF